MDPHTPSVKKVTHPGKRPVRVITSRSINNGFWDRCPEDRSARMEAACERGGVSNFFDLPPEERGRTYDSDY